VDPQPPFGSKIPRFNLKEKESFLDISDLDFLQDSSFSFKNEMHLLKK